MIILLSTKCYKFQSSPILLFFAQENMRSLNLSGHVGFDSLPDQLVNKSVLDGFCFNILCIGKPTKITHLYMTHDFFLVENASEFHVFSMTMIFTLF